MADAILFTSKRRRLTQAAWLCIGSLALVWDKAPTHNPQNMQHKIKPQTV